MPSDPHTGCSSPSPCSTYTPVMDRGYPDTALTEMMRLLDECAKLGRENARLRTALAKVCAEWRTFNSGRPPAFYIAIEDAESILSNIKHDH